MRAQRTERHNYRTWGAGLVLLLALGLAGLAGCGEAAEARPELRVSAAASLGPTLDKLAPVIEAELGVTLQLNLAGSGTLARQLLDGAPADAVILAHPQWMSPLSEAGLVRAETMATLAGNTLVVVGRGEPIRVEQLREPRFGRIALGDPASVPAGRYAEQALRAVGVWDQVQGRLITTADVRAALRYVQTGNVDAALVYASDAADLHSVDDANPLSILVAIDPALHEPIALVGGAVNGSSNGQRLIDWLQGAAAQDALQASGFNPLASASPD